MIATTPAQTCAAYIHARFQDYDDRFRQITLQAHQRFAKRQWADLQSDNSERLRLYPAIIDQTEVGIRDLLKDRVTEESLWAAAKDDFAERIAARADRELAETFFNSVTRRIFSTVGVDRRIEFLRDQDSPPRSFSDTAVYRAYPLTDGLEPCLRRVFSDYAELPLDPTTVTGVLPQIVKRITAHVGGMNEDGPTAHIEMLSSVFYRGQGAFLIGRIRRTEQITPLVLALLNTPAGVAVDALLLDADGVSILFSYTRSAFHVATRRPHELARFLKTIIPAKPDGDIYSALGYFKHGKTMLFRDICRHTSVCTDDRFRISPGKQGMVMIVFDMPGFEMVVKLIRDRFDMSKKTTRTRVMQQYDFVFNHYRVGRLIEAHAFDNLSFDRCMFADELLAQLLAQAAQTVRLVDERVIITHAYLERRVTPLDIYLAAEDGDRGEAVAVDLGNAIKDIALANIFPGDTLLKNFGVTRHGRVVFYDYDEILPLTRCRFRKIPRARTDMEAMADEPWYMVAENDVFPEEFARFLGLKPRHRDAFLQAHADLLSPDFWIAAQEQIRSGNIRLVRPYHDRYRLAHAQVKGP